MSDYPALSQAVAFGLEALAAPPERNAVAGMQSGQVLVTQDSTAAAGLRVELLDASMPATPRVVVSALTTLGGAFALPSGAAADVAAADLWLRVTLADGSALRAHANGWTEITPGTEVALSEIVRLRKAGAFAARPLTLAELVAGEQSLNLLWQGQPGGQAVSTGVAALLALVRFHAPWNALLERYALTGPANGAGDIAGVLGVSAQHPSTVVPGAGQAARAVTFDTHCSADASVAGRADCSVSSPNALMLSEDLTLLHTGLRLKAGGGPTPLGSVLQQIGELPLIEFPHAVGTRVLFENQRLDMVAATNTRAAVRVTRRTYPLETIHALGRQVRAVQVVLEYEIALIDASTRQQTDVLFRDRRWYSPQAGRVRVEYATLQRTAAAASVGSAGITSSTPTAVADNISGSVFAAAVQPFAGVAAVRSLALRHRHAVYASTRNRIYAATHAGGGQILELHPDTLATTRSVTLPAVPGRLALSRDGGRLYAGLDGGEVVELELDGFTALRRFALLRSPSGELYDRVFDMAVDPRDSQRILVLAGRGTRLGINGPVLVYRNGVAMTPTSRTDDYGWPRYSPDAIAWADSVDEFYTAFLGSPYSQYRFRIGNGTVTEVSSLQRVDDVGLDDVGGELLTGQGQLLDATTFTQRRQLRLDPFRLQNCQRFTSTTSFCGINSGTAWQPPFYVHLDTANGAFLGTYRPVVTQVLNGCSEASGLQGSMGLMDLRTAAMGDGRSLVSALAGSDGTRCTLQVWKLQGVTP